jgi:3-hydroxy acid dehydrogenase/malonic semialdehyde reductase
MTAFCPTVVLITGASSGFGSAVAERFAARGVRVVLAARRLDKLRALQHRLGEKAVALELDVRDTARICEALASLPSEFREVDCLINNAGLALGISPAQAADPGHWERMIETNCLGLAAMTRAVLPGMVERGRGHVINIGSVAGRYPYPGANVYGATKAFVHQFSLALRSDLHGTGVRVSCLEPGMCGGTEFSQVRFEGDASRAAAVYKGMQPIMPQDIAESVEWLATRPQHLNVNVLEMMPTQQSLGVFQVARSGNE